ncbi:MAG: helix-turn-helix domain-containing protein [Clostridiales bacterium]|nr:helix-turn-helix domain-containing protein [Clostridiales bacterium]
MFDAYEDVVKIEDVCEMLNIGKNKAYSLLMKGELHGFKIGRIWKISKKSIIEYIEHNTKQYQ